MFVSAWIDRHLNFGNNSTNRVESQHAVLKKYLKSTKSTLHKFVGCINRLVQSQHTSIKESFENSRTVRYQQHNMQCFKLLHGFVSNEALNIIVTNHRQVHPSNCDCRLRKSSGLPCSCELLIYKSSGTCIPLDSIDIFWRKLDFSPATSVQEDDDDDSCESALEHFKENYNKQSKDGRKSWLRKLMNIFNPGTTDIREPRVQKNTRGRPKKSQQKKRVEFCSTRYSCSTMPNFVNSGNEPARHSCFEFDLNEVTTDCGFEFDLNEEPPVNDTNLMDDIPEVFHSNQPFSHTTETHNPYPNMYTNEPYFVERSMNSEDYLTAQGLKDFLPYITQVQNVVGDGNCGFRSTAICIGDHQDNWRQIRMDLLDELSVRNERYRDIFTKEGVQSLRYRLNHFEVGFAYPQYWMSMPDMGLLIASRYNAVVIFLSKEGDATCFPLFTSQPRSQPHNIYAIARFNGNHFVRLVLQGDFPIPPTHPQWSTYTFDQTWETPYLYRQNVYNQIRISKCNSVRVKTCINIDD